MIKQSTNPTRRALLSGTEALHLTLLAFLTLFFCWLFAGRFGIFGAKVDWISQHSVLPEYFRQQFYETGQLFPEFAPNIGGGQNIYNFSYYGLYSPVVLLSYALPFIKMGDYLMAASILGLLSAVLLLYIWLRKRNFNAEISFLTSLLFLLAGPMIYHAYSQLMFVNYMPFLCLALLGVDRYFEKEKRGLYTISVFLMIMTSFYFSIGGMLVLVLYGLHRYYEQKKSTGIKCFLTDGVRFLLPMLTAVLMSGILLAPTAAALMGRQGAGQTVTPAELLIPDISVRKFFYSPYGIGLTPLVLAVLLTGLTYRKCAERVLAWGCAAVMGIPLFCYLLNGGLYIREKVLIPFLPLLCYLTAYYLRRLQKGEGSFLAGLIPCILTIGYILIGINGMPSSISDAFLLLDSIIMLFCFFISGKHRSPAVLLVPALLGLTISGMYLHSGNGHTVDRAFYQKVTDERTAEMAEEALNKENGFYRTEVYGDAAENAAFLNRILTGRQYSTSLYSSTYNEDYRNFRTQIFHTEEPFRNFLMQSASSNPLFRQLMGVKYILSETPVPGYQLSETAENKTASGKQLYVNDAVAPVIYATDRILSESKYRSLPFPWNQTALAEYAVVPNAAKRKDDWEKRLKEETTEITGHLDVKSMESHSSGALIRIPEGYRIQSAKNFRVSLPLVNADESDGTASRILYLQFKVKNLQSTKDVSIWLNGVRNKLSAASHIYYNSNTTFTWASAIGTGSKEANLTLGKGDYEITDIKAFLGPDMTDSAKELYQSPLKMNREETKGNRISGSIETDKSQYVITSIPYDDNFEVLVDGKKVSYEQVNTAFLGFPVDKGIHSIRIIYHAPGLTFGKWLTLSGILLYMLFVSDRCRRRNTRIY